MSLYFSEEINPKGNVIARQEFELTYYDVAVKGVSYYTTESSNSNYAIIVPFGLIPLGKSMNSLLLPAIG